MKNTLFYLFFLIFSVQLNGMDKKNLKQYCPETHNQEINQRIIISLQDYDGNNSQNGNTIRNYSFESKIQKDDKDVVGQSPIDIALLSNNKYSVKLLLDTYEESAEYLTCDNGRYPSLQKTDKEMADLLLSYSVFKKQKDNLLRAAIFGHVSKEIAQSAIEHGADVNGKIKGCYPFLIWVLHEHNIEIAKLLIACDRIDINCREFTGNTPLHIVIIYNNSNLIEILLNHEKININQQDNHGLTSLHKASINALNAIEKNDCKDRIQVLDMLLQKGADVTIRDNNKQTPLDIVLSSSESEKRTKILKLFEFYDLNKPLFEREEEIQNAQDNLIEQPQFFTTQKSLLIGGVGFIALLLLYCGYKYNWHVLLHKNFV